MQNLREQDVIQPIDVKKVFYSKNPGLAKMLPGFIFRYLKRIVHQDDNNTFLAKHGMKRNLEFITAVIEDFNVMIDQFGLENIPREGRFVFAANHPLGGFDGMVLMKIISGYFPKFRFLVNDILMNMIYLFPLINMAHLRTKLQLKLKKSLNQTCKYLLFHLGMFRGG
jgi:hypothetical protein